MDSLDELVRRSFRDWGLDQIELTPLAGGITNRNYTFTYDSRMFVVRIPGEQTNLLGIDRANELEASVRAADLGIGPPVVGVLDTIGTPVTQLVPGSHLDSTTFHDRLGEVVQLVRQFHVSGDLRGSFPIHRVVEWHARDAHLHGVPPPPQFEMLHDVSCRIETAFLMSPEPQVPCHNDLLPANVLFDQHRTWLLDYEYAGMNDRYFDLGNLSVNVGLDPDADEHLLQLYFGTVTDRARARLALMKIMSEFREGMWAVVQQAISSLDTDFVSYANERLDNCARLATRHTLTTMLDDAATP